MMATTAKQFEALRAMVRCRLSCRHVICKRRLKSVAPGGLQYSTGVYRGCRLITSH